MGTPDVSEAAEFLEIFRKDYKPAPYHITSVNLTFDLRVEYTRVEARLRFMPNHSESASPPLVLNGAPGLSLQSICVDGVNLDASHYEIQPHFLNFACPPVIPFELHTVVHIEPQKNTECMGLYKSSGLYCTQCEAEGFRSITYFLDRPDVLSIYTVRIEADVHACPVLLGNGNLVEQGGLEGGRHYAVWHDPWPKPSYLFALVAGELSLTQRDYVTGSSKRRVALRMWVTSANASKVTHALDSLEKAMRWDEQEFGLEYDLDVFNVVGVDDFNMGAMENKGLNVFNTRKLLAEPQVATDEYYRIIEKTVAHEYFHNWTGNRVTCRDWFQLTLKEGLTRYRDLQFSGAMTCPVWRRISDVTLLRAKQFTQDASPLSHPVRPDSYIKMDNFYTVTVYEKGAEVVRMYETLLGKEGFRKGMDLYFQRHDGCAVTCEDFLAAMQDANDCDLSQLGRWYCTSGTPHVTASGRYDPLQRTYTLTLAQSLPPTAAGQPQDQPLLIPVKVGLLGPDGRDLPLKIAGMEDRELGTTATLQLAAHTCSWTFTALPCAPVPSLLRGFSAPVKLTLRDSTLEQLLVRTAKDSDAFNRWDASQGLWQRLILDIQAHVVAATSSSSSSSSPLRPVADLCDDAAAAGAVPEACVEAFRAVLCDSSMSGAVAALMLSPPSMAELGEAAGAGVDPLQLFEVVSWLRAYISRRLRDELQAAVTLNDEAPGTPYQYSAAACARRALKNKALELLACHPDESLAAQLLERLKRSTNLTDSVGALGALCEFGGEGPPPPQRQEGLDWFYATWRHEPLVMLTWLELQSTSNVPGNVEALRALRHHPAFTITTPNCCYALFGAFGASARNWHARDGSGYAWLADCVLEVDKINPQVAAVLVSRFSGYHHYNAPRSDLMKGQLTRIVNSPGISSNVFEIASKSLKH